jgi:aspartate/glutamate racemase
MERAVKKQKIQVVGGTPFDAQRGVKLLTQMGVQAQAIGLSTSPDEQTALYQNPEKVIERFQQKVNPAASEEVIIFCNSLSFIADWPAIFSSSIWTLRDYYTELFTQLSADKVAVLVAENSMKENLQKLIEKQGFQKLTEMEIIPNLELIRQLETGTEKQQQALIEQQLDILHQNGFSEVVFGCTHFDHPRFDEGYRGVRIHQPGLRMLSTFVDKQITGS